MIGSWSGATGYLWVAFAALLLVVVSSIFGDHDVANVHDISHGGNGGHDEGPGVLSIRNIAMFFLGFGAAGALGMFYTGSQLQAIAWGSIVGIVMAALVYFVSRFFYQQQATTESSASSLVGKTARVTMDVKLGFAGQISVADQYGTPAVFSALSGDDKGYQEGSIVRISRFEGTTAWIIG